MIVGQAILAVEQAEPIVGQAIPVVEQAELFAAQPILGQTNFAVALEQVVVVVAAVAGQAIRSVREQVVDQAIHFGLAELLLSVDVERIQLPLVEP